MKKSVNKEEVKAKPVKKTNNVKLVSYVLAILIVVPLVYLMYYLTVVKPKMATTRTDTTAVKNTVVDSAQIKIQAAIDLAKFSPNESNYISLSLVYYNCGKYLECAQAAHTALTYNPKSYSAYNNICSAYNMLAYWDEAIVAGKKALEIQPGDPLATNNLKVSTDGKAKQLKGIADAEALVKKTPNETNCLSLGNLYYGARKFELAITSYKSALTYNPKNVVTFNNLCSASNELGKYKEAKEYCETALKIDSTFSLAKNNLKVAEDKLKK
jgi:tetratricopeptide (TPR) repeat protein